MIECIQNDDKRYDFSLLKEMSDSKYQAVLHEYRPESIEMILMDDQCVGWVYYKVPDIPIYSGFIFLYIAPDFRRQGIGTEVYRKVSALFLDAGCNWWSSYPENVITDTFAMHVGFTYTNTNSCLIYEGKSIHLDTCGLIRKCKLKDYPAALDLWSCEYAYMHRCLGIPYEQKKMSEKEKEEERQSFVENIETYYVVEENDSIVGVGTVFPDYSGIGALAVKRSRTGKGYGTMLAQYLTNLCIQHGVNHPIIYCESSNTNAMHIYEKIGYVEKSRESVAVKL